MRLHGGVVGSVAGAKNQLPQVNARQKFKFSWLADEIPNPRAIFYIRGKRYVCEKITATFTENGMSQLLKGEFYPELGMGRKLSFSYLLDCRCQLFVIC